MNEASKLLSGLPLRLHPIDLPPERLPVTGHRLSSDERPPRAAAVLVPILAGGNPEVLLTVRSDKLTVHAGQVAFPGGAADPGDGSPLATALREAAEETGIRRESVQPLGLLDCYDTITGYRMVPVVGLVHGSVSIRLDPAEVDDVFTLPLDWVLDPERYRRHRVVHAGRTWELLAMEHPRHLIWGATAAVLDQLRRRMCGEPD